MDFGIGRDRQLERMLAGEAFNQCGGGGITIGVRHELAAGFRWSIAAQCDHMPHPGVPVLLCDFGDFSLARTDAGEVRGGHQRGFADQPRDGGVGALAGRAACAVSHRNEARG